MICIEMATEPRSILERLRAVLKTTYGDAWIGRFCWLTCARRRDGFDYDVAVFSNRSMLGELDRLAKLRVDFLDETDVFSTPNPIPRCLSRTLTAHARNSGDGRELDAERPARKRAEAMETRQELSARLAKTRAQRISRWIHAAQAFLFDSTGKAFKSHRGVQKEFLRLTKDDPRFTAEQRIFLSQTYNLKAVADYETGPDAEVSAERAVHAVDAGKWFVSHIAGLLSRASPTPPRGNGANLEDQPDSTRPHAQGGPHETERRHEHFVPRRRGESARGPRLIGGARPRPFRPSGRDQFRSGGARQGGRNVTRARP